MESKDNMAPLSGVKVLDLSTAFSGPAVSSLLAAQGAEVIKVEPVGAGDVTRYVGARRKGKHGMSGVFQFLNRGKRSLCLNLKEPAGIELLKKLMAQSDIVLQNFRHGVVERLGIDYDETRKIKPDMIYLSITGFGDRGPLAGEPVYDNVMQAFSGFAELERLYPEDKPSLVQNMVIDKITALYCSQAVSSALYARAVGRGGQHVQVSMMDCAANFLWIDSAMEAGLPGDDVSRERPLGKVPFITAFKNGFGSVSPTSDRAFHGMCQTFGIDSSDPRLATTRDRMSNMDFMSTIFAACARAAEEFDVDEAIRLLRENDVPCSKVMSVADLPSHPQARAVDLFQHTQHPVLGDVVEPRPAALFSEMPFDGLAAAPTLGQHTDEILGELGMEAELSSLRERGIIH